MKKSIIPFALVLLGGLPLVQAGTDTKYTKQISTPATERIGMGFYGAIFGGANVYQSIGFDSVPVHAGGRTVRADGEYDSSTGWFAGLKLGYVFDTHSFFLPALEVEGFYNTVDAAVTGRSPDFNSTAHVDARLNTGVFMLNFLTKFDLGHFRPYIGAGVGAAYLEVDQIHGRLDVAGANGGEVVTDGAGLARAIGFHDNQWDFAWQAIGGFDYYFTPKLSVFAEYKALWFYSDNSHTDDYLEHLVGGGVRYHF